MYFKTDFFELFLNTVLLLLFSEIMHCFSMQFTSFLCKQKRDYHLTFMKLQYSCRSSSASSAQMSHLQAREATTPLKKSRIIIWYYCCSFSHRHLLDRQSRIVCVALQSLENVWSSTKTDEERYETLSHFTLVYGTSSIVIYGSQCLKITHFFNKHCRLFI